MNRDSRRTAAPVPTALVSDAALVADAERRARALQALREGRFDLAESLLAREDVDRTDLIENLRIYQAELEIQNEELIRSQRQAQDALERFMAFFNSLPVAELVIDRQGVVREANTEARRLFGLHDTHFHQYFFARLVDERNRAAFIQAWNGLHPREAIELPEIRLRDGTPSGFIGDLHIAALPPGPNGDFQFVCAVLDRTETVQRREALRAATEHLSESEANLTERLKELGALHEVLAETASDAPVPDVLQRIVERLPAAWLYPHLAEARLTLPHARHATPGFVATDLAQRARIVLPDGAEGELMVAYRIQANQPGAPSRALRFLDEEQHLLDTVATHVAGFLARRHAEDKLRQAAQVFESTAEGMVITDANGRFLAVNRAFTEITGYAEDEVLGKTPRLLRSGRHDASFYRALWQTLNATGQWRGEIWNRRRDGEIYPEFLTISAVTDSQGVLTNYVGVFRDISQIKHSEAQLAHLTHHDPLTDLPNRALFQARLEQCLQRAERNGTRLALLFLDLDRFKQVNDSLGHPVGDALIQRVALRLARRLRSSDTLARLGGDEFVVIVEDLAAPHQAASLAQSLLASFEQPFHAGERELFISASLGISLYPDDGTDLDTLVRHADIAMYRAKDEGRNGYSFYERAMSEGAIERLRLEQDLRGALDRREILLHYQPQTDLDSRRLIGVEALCRWRHPRLGMIPPDQFIPLAEEIGLIAQIDLLVLEEACQQLALWDRAGFRIPQLAVNLSMREIERPDLVEQVRAVLERTGIAPHRLELEVTESMLMQRTAQALISLEGLRRLGVTLAVDDFGTGYSSLAYLKRLPLNRLKIDRSFVEGLTQDPNDDSIVRAIVALAHSLGMDVVAEGIETEIQAAFLLGEGCRAGQGYLFDRPMTATDLAARWSDRVADNYPRSPQPS